MRDGSNRVRDRGNRVRDRVIVCEIGVIVYEMGCNYKLEFEIPEIIGVCQ